jgi:hypothetical protein
MNTVLEMMNRVQAFDGTRDQSVQTSIGVIAVLIGLLMLGSVTDATAWGSKGHRIIGLIAQDLLLPETRSEVETIMGSADLATFGLYLDDNKDRLDQQIPGSRAWHYDNIPLCGRKSHSEYCPNGSCASTQIARHRAILGDPNESKSHKQFAVWALTHLIGDIHQPLHAADHDDRGGNMIQVRLSWGRKANLHAAWDTDFIEHAFGGKNEKLVAHELRLKFASRKTDWQTGTVQAWMDESHQLAKTAAYGKIAGFTCSADLTRTRIPLNQNYSDEATTVVEEQLAKAGYRLVYFLNLSLSN